MNGKTHKAIGTSVGLSLALYGILVGRPEMAFSVVTAPFGSMLPDIDHPNTKLGRKRKEVMSKVKRYGIAASILAGGIASYMLVKSAGVYSITVFATLGLLTMLLVFISKNPAFQYMKRFIRKHRGIMHTLLVPAECFLLTLFIPNSIIDFFIVGLYSGYLSHLVADCYTEDGCPIKWPITVEVVSIAKVRCGSKAEKVVGFILGAGSNITAVVLSYCTNLYYLLIHAVICFIATIFVGKVASMIVRE